MIIRATDTAMRPVSHQKEFDKHVILSKGIVPGLLQCATASFNADDAIAPHMHESMTEIFYILSGKVRLQLDTHQHILEQGDAFTVFPGITHGIDFLTVTKLFYFNIETLLKDDN